MSEEVGVSVCMATFNGGKYFMPQLRSILSQLAECDELIISDNGSTDGTRELAAAIASTDARIKCLDHPATSTSGKRNLIANFENALKASQGAYIFLSDQDDLWVPNRLSVALAALAEFDFVAGDAQVIDDQGVLVSSSYLSQNGMRRGWWRALYRNPFLGCTIGMRRAVLAKALPFPDGIPMHDIYLGMIAETFFEPTLLNMPLVQYRRHGSNASSATEVSPYSWTEKFGFRYQTLRAITVAALR